MVWSVYEAAFRDLRKLADWFSTGSHRSAAGDLHLGAGRLVQLVRRLGATAIPLLMRELRGPDPQRRDAARDALGAIARHGDAARMRVTAALRTVIDGDAADDAKVVAVGLLSDLGERADARFADPTAIRTRAAIALAGHLETAADVAGAADLMVRQLEPEDIVQMLEVMADAAPAAVHRLAGELVLRLDIAGDVRDRVAVIAAMLGDDRDRAPRSADPRRRTQAAVLVDGAGRRVVIASCWLTAARRWRRWAVLIGAAGRIEDCLHDDNAGPHGDASALSAALCGDGYRVASTELDRAHDIVAAAARATVEAARALPSSYYLGRDLLDLGDAHVRGPGARRDPAAAALARAVELVAAGEPARALPLLERCDPGHPDAAAALAAALLAQDRPAAAIPALDRALAAEPDWPLHHWNLAVALRRLGDHRGCHHALCRFVATSAAPSGLSGDPDQAARLRWAERAIAELERGAWIERGSGSCAT